MTYQKKFGCAWSCLSFSLYCTADSDSERICFIFNRVRPHSVYFTVNRSRQAYFVDGQFPIGSKTYCENIFINKGDTNFLVQQVIEQCQNRQLSCSCNKFAPLILITRTFNFMRPYNDSDLPLRAF